MRNDDPCVYKGNACVILRNRNPIAISLDQKDKITGG